jgi:hypothetical protein
MINDRYDFERGDYSLISVSPLPLDNQLRKLVRSFRTWDTGKRQEVQQALSKKEILTLLLFVKRSAILAVNENSAERCEDGLLALSMIEVNHVDYRDVSAPVDLMSYAMAEIGADRKTLLDQAVSLATPRMMITLLHAGRTLKISDLCYTEVRTEDGRLGLIPSGLAMYNPTLDMTKLALKIAAAVQSGKYVADLRIREKTPSIWFAKEFRSGAEKLLKQALAGFVIHGTLRKKHNLDASSQLFIQWVVEMPSESEAATLVEYIGGGENLEGRFSIGVNSGRLFSLLVGGSFQQDVPPFESQDSLAKLAEATKKLLAEAVSETH